MELKEAPVGVRAFDREGHEVIVPRDVWANDVLPGMIRQAWEDPEQLSMVVANSLTEGFVAEATEAAAHLYEIDRVPARGASLWGAVLIRLERLVEAEMVLSGCVERHGDNGPVLATLAQVYAAKGEEGRAEATLARANALVAEQQMQIGMVRVDGPVWLPVGSPARKLFGMKAEGAPTVTFLGGSAEATEQPDDALAGMTRALPLFLSEQTEMRTAAAGRALLPWAVGVEGVRSGGFVVSSAPWPDATAVQAVQDPANRSDYVVTVHVDAEVEPWEATLKFIRASDGGLIGELNAEFSAESPAEGLTGLADEVVELLSALGAAETTAAYVVPAEIGRYLRGLEELLAMRCAEMPGARRLGREREVLVEGFELCEAEPENLPARLLLMETLGGVERSMPEIAAEFRKRFERLAGDWPIRALEGQAE